MVYQPQAISWPDRQKLTSRAAIAITPAGQTKPILGTIRLAVVTHVDEASGVITLSDPELLETQFPSLDTEQAAALEAQIRAGLSEAQMPHVPLTSVLLSLGESPVPSVALNNDPPTIYYASRPASLVVFNGEPVLAPIGKTGLSAAVNTNWDVFLDDGVWYLLDDDTWFSAPAATGPYAPVARVPPNFSNLLKDASFANVRKDIPAPPPKPADRLPTIFVSTKPAEIIVTSGTPQFAPVPKTGLERVTNTPSTLFFDPAQGRFYLMLSGRWFSASSLNGPWEFATDKLPPDFALIPPDDPAGAVLTSVPGTVQAQEAVLKAQIPTMATLKRHAVTIKVVYAGLPKFEPIPGTHILYAVNTATVVLKVDDKYYACENGAWFVALTPNGPWVLADSIPPVIKTIPPSSPLYPVTYVEVYAATPTTVTCGYTEGYMLGYVADGVLVYGTGYYYQPYVTYASASVGYAYPYYYAYPYTYAGNVYYNAYTGAWASGGTVYGYGGAATAGAYYNPSNGAWAAGGAIYGPYGGEGAFAAYNPSTGSYAYGGAYGSNGYGYANGSFYNARTGVSGSTSQNWGSSTFTGPYQTVNTASASNAYGSAAGFASSTGAAGAGYYNRVTGNSGGAVRTANGDVYAGRDGNVYEHTSSGWSKWSNGGWTSVQTPSTRSSYSNSASTQANRSYSNTSASTRPNRSSYSNLAGTQANRPSSSNLAGNQADRPSSSNLARTQGGAQAGGWRNQLDQGGFQQLQRDRLGREAGGAGLGSRFAGGGFPRPFAGGDLPRPFGGGGFRLR